MHRVLCRIVLIAGLLLSVDSLSAADETSFPSLADLLPTKTVKADIMGAQPPAQAIALGAKFQAAIASKSDWWAAYQKQHAGKTPLPYHSNFGLTAEEYEKFIALSQQFKLVKTGEATLTVQRNPVFVTLRIAADGATQTIRFDIKRGSVVTPLTGIKEATQRDSGDESGLLGHHRSYNWQKTLGNVDGGTYSAASLTLGTITETGREFIQYRAAKVSGGEAKERTDLLLLYDAQGEAVEPVKEPNGKALDKRAEEKIRSELDRAIFRGKVEDIEKILGDKAIGVDHRDFGQNTPLFVAVRHRKTDVIEYLLKKGADINAVNRAGHTPLWQAVMTNRAETVEVLLKNGAKANATDKLDRTPLFHAVLSGKTDIAESLIKAGANVNQRDKTGSTPLKLATDLRKTEMVAFLKKHRAK